jgi:glycerol-3-phosphate acyltransferase PlsX
MPEGIVIAVDAMGGDNAPRAIVEGSIRALKEFPDLSIKLYGPEAELKALTEDAADVHARLQIVHAPDVIDMHEPPVLAVRRKTASSLVMAALAVKGGEAQALLSAGPTGAVLACGMLRVGRIPGIERPALAPVLPGLKRPFLLIDCGANVDCQPKYLAQFGLMGEAYMRGVLGVREPSVMLANIGAEAEKGNALVKQAHEWMSRQKRYRFDGNVEGRDIPLGACDVVVADGFSGNLILKYTEGMAGAIFGMLKEEMTRDAKSKLGALLLKDGFKRLKKRLDYEEYGGAPLLGVEGAVVKAHGSSGARAFQSAVRQARTMVKSQIVQTIRTGVENIHEGEETYAE